MNTVTHFTLKYAAQQTIALKYTQKREGEITAGIENEN